jgi:hypothetical protein
MTSRLILPVTLFALCGCKPMAVQLATEEPLKVDIKMKLDVYQHEAGAAARKPDIRAADDPEVARRMRMGEIQNLKNSRLVGEDRLGLLVIRNLPTGEYGDYVKKTVEAENADRAKLMDKLAKERGVSKAEIQRRQAELFRQSAFSGEWYEEQEPGGDFVWKQKP